MAALRRDEGILSGYHYYVVNSGYLPIVYVDTAVDEIHVLSLRTVDRRQVPEMMVILHSTKDRQFVSTQLL